MDSNVLYVVPFDLGIKARAELNVLIVILKQQLQMVLSFISRQNLFYFGLEHYGG